MTVEQSTRGSGMGVAPSLKVLSFSTTNKRQRENLARYPNLGFTHFVERTEFQGRGSAHGHALWWHPHAPGVDGGCGKEMGVSPLC